VFYDRRTAALAGQPNAVEVKRPDVWQGADLVINYRQEFADLLNQNNDLGLINGAESIVAALIRRLATSAGGYRRLYRTISGVSSCGNGLENEMYSKLSSRKTSGLVDEITQYIKTAAQVDGRIEILEVRGQKTYGDLPLVFNIIYRLQGSDQIQQLSYQL